MAATPKKIGLYLITGVTLAVVIITALVTAGIQIPSINQNKNTGILAVYIKDAPVELSKLEVTINSIEVQGPDDGWTPLSFTEGTTSVKFDLLTLQDVAADLSVAELPAGSYSKIRLHIQDATATFTDDSTEELKVPSEKVDIIIKFDIEEGATTQVLIDMTADPVAISNSNNLRPVIKATVIPNPPPTVDSLTENSPTTSPTETPQTTPTENPEETTAPPTTEAPPSETPTATPTGTV